MRNVALVPQRHVFKSHQTVGPDNASHAANAFGDNRIPFVWHGARPLLAGRKTFLSFIHFGALPVSNVERKLIERRSDDSERAEILSVAIPLNDLGRNWSGPESQPGTNLLLNFRIEQCKRADGATNFSDRDRLPRALQAFTIAAHLVVPEGERQSERCRLRVYAVGASDLRRVSKLEGASFQHREERFDLVEQKIARLSQEERISCVYDVGRSQTVVDEAGGVANVFREVGGKRNDVVIGRPLDFVDAFNRKIRA